MTTTMTHRDDDIRAAFGDTRPTQISRDLLSRAIAEFRTSEAVEKQKIPIRTELEAALATPHPAAADAQVSEPEPYAYIYEHDTPYGIHRRLEYGTYNGVYPQRTIKVYAHPAPLKPHNTAKISDYLNAPGMWAQVYCCTVFVRGWPSDMARSAADGAVKEFGDDACKTVADLTYTLDEVLRVD